MCDGSTASSTGTADFNAKNTKKEPTAIFKPPTIIHPGPADIKDTHHCTLLLLVFGASRKFCPFRKVLRMLRGDKSKRQDMKQQP